MRYLFSCLCASALIAAALPVQEKAPQEPSLDRNEAKKAFAYINKVRADPPAFSKDIGADLGEVKPRPALKWDDVLAKVAEEKALDMARRKYFGHVTPDGRAINILMHEAGYKLPPRLIAKKEENSFENIGAGGPVKGEALTRQLILDKGVADLIHRRNILGMDEWAVGHKDIGIGFVNDPSGTYKNLICIIIAHHPDR
jgi:uncharacterized protein YkwD